MRFKQTYLLILILSFWVFLITPSVAVLLGDEAAVSYLMDAAEEEEQKEEGKEKDVKELVLHSLHYWHPQWTEASEGEVLHPPSDYLLLSRVPFLPPPEVLS